MDKLVNRFLAGDIDIGQYQKSLGNSGADIYVRKILKRQCREFYEGSGLMYLVERSKEYADNPFAKRIMSAFL